jgi:hypothetical protein
MIDSGGMFFLGSKVAPMNLIRDVKLGAGCASHARESHVLARTITPEADEPTPVVIKRQPNETSQPDGKCQESSAAPCTLATANHEPSLPNHSVAPNVVPNSSPPNSDLCSQSSRSSRRSIFRQYSRPEEDTDSNDDTAYGKEQSDTTNILEFSPPLDHRYELQKRFKMIDDFPLDKNQDLPPLPSPLLRYTREGEETCGGMYPLTKRKSILRQGKFSLESNRSSSSLSDDRVSSTTNDTASSELALELSSEKAIHAQKLSDFERISRNMTLEESKQFFRQLVSTASVHEPLVKFDPRIVITEFPDDGERTWFTDDDLDRFKRETLMLAQHYMMLHPDVAEEYNMPKFDPITGKMRKKPLYALPGLCSADGLDSFGSSDEIERLLKNAVQNILIVDPNKSILHLFEKCMHEMFPNAYITLIDNGEDALRIYTTELKRQNSLWDVRNRGFDIVLVEERLNHRKLTAFSKSRRTIHHGFRLTRIRSDSTAYASSATALRAVEEQGIPKQNSEVNLPSLPRSNFGTSMSGSQLIRQIQEAEEHFYNQSSKNPNDHGSEVSPGPEESSVFSPPQRWSLLIGVTVNLERDEQKLKDSGADLVWGKPPPKICNSLRNKLISCLVTKRQKASFCLKIPAS